MATINDVARVAGVSRMTVSRVINSNGYVKQETKLRVQDVIKTLQYRPSIIAKTLATRENRTIAYIMVNISDPFHNLVIQGIESIAYKSHYTTLICDAHSPSREQDYIDMFKDHCVSGAIFHHLALTADQIDELQKNGTRCVMMDNEDDIINVNSVNTDNYSGASAAIGYLYSKGHRRIGCVHGLLNPSLADGVPYEDTFQFNLWRQRTCGYCDSMSRLGLSPMLYQSNGRGELAKIHSKEIVNNIINCQEKPTALYCENDIMAIAIINQLQEYGLNVPNDIAVIGHDGLDICHMIHPYITTIAQPRFEMGQEAGNMLIGLIEKRCENKNLLLQPCLQLGETA